MISKEDQLERERLCQLYIERDKEFQSAKTRRVVFTLIGFAIFYFFLLCNLKAPTGWGYLVYVLCAVFFSVIHFIVNDGIFSRICIKGREEADRLQAILEKIQEIDRRNGIDHRTIFDRFRDGF